MKDLKTYEHTCEFKQRFDSKDSVMQVVRAMRKRGKIVFEYRCNVCDHWHFSSTRGR